MANWSFCGKHAGPDKPPTPIFIASLSLRSLAVSAVLTSSRPHCVGLSEPLLWLRPLSGSLWFAFRMPKLLFTMRFILRYALSKISAFRAGKSIRSAVFHLPKLLFATRFILGFLLTKIRAGRASGFLSLRGLTSARKQVT